MVDIYIAGTGSSSSGCSTRTSSTSDEFGPQKVSLQILAATLIRLTNAVSRKNSTTACLLSQDMYTWKKQELHQELVNVNVIDNLSVFVILISLVKYWNLENFVLTLAIASWRFCCLHSVLPCISALKAKQGHSRLQLWSWTILISWKNTNLISINVYQLVIVRSIFRAAHWCPLLYDSSQLLTAHLQMHFSSLGATVHMQCLWTSSSGLVGIVSKSFHWNSTVGKSIKQENKFGTPDFLDIFSSEFPDLSCALAEYRCMNVAISISPTWRKETMLTKPSSHLPLETCSQKGGTHPIMMATEAKIEYVICCIPIGLASSMFHLLSAQQAGI